MERRCEQTLLARGAVTEVVYCRHCRVFHVNVGAVTVHFDAPALWDLHDVLAGALAVHECMTNTTAAAEWRPPADVQ